MRAGSNAMYQWLERTRTARLTRRSVLEGVAATGLTIAETGVHALPMPQDLSHLSPERRAEFDRMHARMMAAFAFERVTVPGGEALAEWQRLRHAGRGWPVVIGGDEDLERLAEQFSIEDPEAFGFSPDGTGPRSPAAILDAAAALRFPDDLRKWPGVYRPEDLTAKIGEWPARVGSGGIGLSVATDLVSRRYHDRVHILLVPAKASWEVPAYLRWGNWNACPPPEYHVAALRDWHRRFGAELAGMNGDTMNIVASRHPPSRNEALAFAREMYGYCPDIVDQGVETLSALAAELRTSDWWYLWWD